MSGGGANLDNQWSACQQVRDSVAHGGAQAWPLKMTRVISNTVFSHVMSKCDRANVGLR